MSRKNYTSIDNLVRKYTSSKQQMGSFGPSKETEPFRKQEAVAEQVQETVEHQPEKEVSIYVTPRAETIEIPPDLKQFGLQPITTTQFPSYQNIKLPISDEKISVGLHAPITTSMRWLATLALYLLQKAHLGLKVIHGRVVRVIRS